MALFDLETLLVPLSDEAPCGPDLRGEPDFRDIEDAPGAFANQKPPELLKVVRQCAELLTRTKDQMLAIVAVQAAARAGDIATANEALAFIARLTDEQWEHFHPGPADEMVIGRINELSALTRPAAVVLPLQRLGLAAMPGAAGTEFSTGMLAQAMDTVPEWTEELESKLAAQVESGALTSVAARSVKPTHEGARQLRIIMLSLSPAARSKDAAEDAVPSDFDADATRPLALALRGQLIERRAQLQAMSDHFYTLMEIYQNRASDSPSFGPITAQLKTMLKAIDDFLEAFPEPGEGEGEATGDAGESGGAVAVAGAPARSRGFSGDTPRTRADVITALDAIKRYYAEHEPTSPVPLMLNRVRDWVEMDFMRLMRDIAPESAGEVAKLLAIDDE
ncbi:type VI secretion system protein TssA [Sandaracinobacteroides saxicola]|uniref:Type VI secretion system ImpA family N-terminal domain-containing protein n=1 Tax=Sandaracinobacteroides saxicola TaxID=2759707 RepID=A0A7G5IJ05_9SPHN|nr:type VI secretion system ImpA family N-terminal domain-containing protein [Sandaracinobacteroides saxicola]QMW23347.1 type VI secretion system ImpA family N-terminal domain-containing protein [Sandaracinobacteroides saxicola]